MLDFEHVGSVLLKNEFQIKFSRFGSAINFNIANLYLSDPEKTNFKVVKWTQTRECDCDYNKDLNKCDSKGDFPQSKTRNISKIKN